MTARDGCVEFDLAPPFLPFYVPKDARKALELVPLQDELNRFRLRATPPAGDAALVLSIDGKTAGVFTAEELARGIDLGLLDKPPGARRVACSWTWPSTAGRSTSRPGGRWASTSRPR